MLNDKEKFMDQFTQNGGKVIRKIDNINFEVEESLQALFLEKIKLKKQEKFYLS